MKLFFISFSFNLFFISIATAQFKFNQVFLTHKWNCNTIIDNEQKIIVNGWNTNACTLYKTEMSGSIINADIQIKGDTFFGPGWVNTLLQHSDSTYFSCGSFGWLDSNLYGGIRTKAMLAKYSKSGSLLWLKHFGGNTTRKILQTHGIVCLNDTVLYVSGCVTNDQSPGSPFSNYLAKVDTAGNVIWEKYWKSTSSSDGSTSISTFNNRLYLGSFYITGFNYQTFNTYNFPLFQKLDTAGNILTSKTIAGRAFKEGEVGVLSTRKASNVYLPDHLIGFFIIDTSTENGKNWYPRIPVLYGLDTNLNVIWENTIFREKKLVPRNITTVSNNRTLVYGMQYMQKNWQGDGWAVLLDANQKVIWERTFHYRDSADHYFTGATECPDGGFVFCGSVSRGINTANMQSAWLIKTDSLGCIDNANCFPMGISSTPVVNTTITIYPNPANDVLQISCDAFAENSKIQFIITDMQGQQELKNVALAYGQKCNIAIGSLQIGTYIITILHNHQMYHQTFIKN